MEASKKFLCSGRFALGKTVVSTSLIGGWLDLDSLEKTLLPEIEALFLAHKPCSVVSTLAVLYKLQWW